MVSDATAPSFGMISYDEPVFPAVNAAGAVVCAVTVTSTANIVSASTILVLSLIIGITPEYDSAIAQSDISLRSVHRRATTSSSPHRGELSLVRLQAHDSDGFEPQYSRDQDMTDEENHSGYVQVGCE